MGPFSLRVYGAIEAFKENNQIEVMKSNSIEIFNLTKSFRKKLDQNIKQFEKRFSEVAKIVREVKSMNVYPEDFITAYVYLKYPEYCEKSEVLEAVPKILIKYINMFRELMEKIGLSDEEIITELKRIRKEYYERKGK